VELPGVSQDGIKMEASGRIVLIDADGTRGKFSTIQAVGFDPDPDRMSVTFTQGVLEILLLAKGAPPVEMKMPQDGNSNEPEALRSMRTELERVTCELKKISDERTLLQCRVVNLQKDFQNLKRRHEEEKFILAERRVEDIALALIEVLDNFERARASMEGIRTKRAALDPFLKGVGMVEDRIGAVFSQLGIVPIESVGRTFDPAFHMSVETADIKDRPDMEVVSEKLRGYIYKGKVLRPANVVVNRGACEHTEDSQSKKVK